MSKGGPVSQMITICKLTEVEARRGEHTPVADTLKQPWVHGANRTLTWGRWELFSVLRNASS